MSALSRRQFVGVLLAKATLITSSGCGTVLHPERRGQPAGPLDWKIVALDAIGLLLFFIPGVIAFAVDFSNGTIYLPSHEVGTNGAAGAPSQQRLVTRSIPKEEITIAKLEQVLSQHEQRQIQLTPGTYKTVELERIDDFWATVEQHLGDEPRA